MDNNIATVHTAIANIPFLTGYSPKRWQNEVNALIQKEEGNYRVDKLRTIFLYEADYKFNNKALVRQMMQNAEQNNLLALEQYGSRKQKTAI